MRVRLFLWTSPSIYRKLISSKSRFSGLHKFPVYVNYCELGVCTTSFVLSFCLGNINFAGCYFQITILVYYHLLPEFRYKIVSMQDNSCTEKWYSTCPSIDTSKEIIWVQLQDSILWVFFLAWKQIPYMNADKTLELISPTRNQPFQLKTLHNGNLYLHTCFQPWRLKLI